MNIVWVTIISVLSKMFGLLRELGLAQYFGTTRISDAYIIAITIPVTLFSCVNSALVASYIPAISKIKNNESWFSVDIFTNKLLLWWLAGCVVVNTVIFCTPKYFVLLFASGAAQETIEMASYLVKYTQLGIFFSILATIFGGYLNVRGKYAVVAAVGIPYNIMIYISMILASRFDIVWLGYGAALAFMIQCAPLVCSAIKCGYRFSLDLRIADNTMYTFLRLTAPVFLSMSVIEINIIVDRTLASHFYSGAISSIVYAGRLSIALYGILGAPVLTVLFPRMAEFESKADRGAIAELLTSTVVKYLLILTPICFMLILCSKEIITIIYQRGAFGLSSVKNTSVVFSGFAFGLIWMIIRDLLVRGLYSIQENKLATLNSVIAAVLNIIFSLLLVYPLGLIGIPMASGISMAVCSCLIVKSLKQRNVNVSSSLIFSIAVRSIIASGVALAVIHWAWIITGINVGVLVSSVTKCVTYIALVLLIYKVFGVICILRNCMAGGIRL